MYLLYGTIVVSMLFPAAGLLGVVDLGALPTAFGWGLAYGDVLFLVAVVLWMNVVLDLDTGPQQAGLFSLFHLVYGAMLGAWLGYGLLA